MKHLRFDYDVALVQTSFAGSSLPTAGGALDCHLNALQLSARAAYGAELRRQIEEKEREKKANKGVGHQQQLQHPQSYEQAHYSRNRYEFERARVAGGGNASGMDALQRPAVGGSLLPPLNMGPPPSNGRNVWNRPMQQHDQQMQQQQQQQPVFRAKNEITAPGKSHLQPSFYIQKQLSKPLKKNCPLFHISPQIVMTGTQANMMLQRRMRGGGSSRNTGWMLVLNVGCGSF